MGNQRLGTLPDTAPWREVVAEVAEGADVACVAAATMAAALKGFNLANGDRGLLNNILFLVRLVQAARAEDFAAALDHAGMPPGTSADYFSVISAFSEAVDRRLHKTGGRTDLTEMAQLAAIESLAILLRDRANGLF